MNIFRYEIFDKEAEITAYKRGTSCYAEFIFDSEEDGFLSIGDVAVRVRGGVGKADVRLLDDGEHIPILILKGKRILLPRIKKKGRTIELADCEQDYLRGISLRERALARRVEVLEAAVERLSESVYGKSLFSRQ